MPRAFPLTIATPLATLFQGEAEALRVPAANGQLGVLAGHAPLVAALTVGEVRVIEPSGAEHSFASAGGVLRVETDGVAVVSEIAEAAESIDVARAHKALERARDRLTAESGGGDVDTVRAELALARATNRLKVAGHQLPA